MKRQSKSWKISKGYLLLKKIAECYGCLKLTKYCRKSLDTEDHNRQCHLQEWDRQKKQQISSSTDELKSIQEN